MPHPLADCDICHRKTLTGIAYNGLSHTPPLDDPIDETVTPGRNEITLDMPHAAYADCSSASPAMKKLVAEIDASDHFQSQQRMAAMDIGLPMQWTTAGLAQAVLDQQVLKRAFEEQWPDRRIEFVAHWPQTTVAKAADGTPEKHVHARFRVEGDAVTPQQVQDVIAHAKRDYDRLSDDVMASGFLVSELQTAVGRSLKFGASLKR